MSPTDYSYAFEITCEVCGTPQPPASECVECGMRLHLPEGVEPSADPRIERLVDLEPTVQQPVGDLYVGLIPDFDPTVQAPTAPARRELMPDLDPTAMAKPDLPGYDERLPDLERTFEVFEKSEAGYEANPASCPYCGFRQSVGRVCDNCGRSRFKFMAAPVQKARVPTPDGDLPQVHCRRCGSSVLLRTVCSECGQPLPPLES